MSTLRKVPIWAWFVAGFGLLLLLGDCKMSMGNVSVGGKDLGGFSTE